MDVRLKFLQNGMSHHMFEFTYIPSADNDADIGTKVLPLPIFRKLRDRVTGRRTMEDRELTHNLFIHLLILESELGKQRNQPRPAFFFLLFLLPVRPGPPAVAVPPRLRSASALQSRLCNDQCCFW